MDEDEDDVFPRTCDRTELKRSLKLYCQRAAHVRSGGLYRMLNDVLLECIWRDEIELGSAIWILIVLRLDGHGQSAVSSLWELSLRLPDVIDEAKREPLRSRPFTHTLWSALRRFRPGG